MTPSELGAVNLGAELKCSCCKNQEGGTKLRPVHLKALVTRECHLPPKWRDYSKANNSTV